LAVKPVIWIAALLLAGLAFAAWTHYRAARAEAAAEAAYPPQGRLIDVDGVAVHARVMGAGPDLVLLHGASGNTREFTFRLTEMLADRYRVILFDRPGLGHSDPLHGRGESPREQARVLRAAAAELGVDTPILGGHSYGGAVALAWALEAPEDVAAVVSIAGAAFPWPGKLAPFYRYLDTWAGRRIAIPLITAYLPEPVLREQVAGVFAPQSLPEGYVDHIAAPLSIRRATMRANVRQVAAVKPHLRAMAKDYARLEMPIEIVHGTADDTVPLDIHSGPLAETAPGARLTRLEQVGHMPHQVTPDIVVEAIDRAAERAGLRSAGQTSY